MKWVLLAGLLAAAPMALAQSTQPPGEAATAAVGEQLEAPCVPADILAEEGVVPVEPAEQEQPGVGDAERITAPRPCEPGEMPGGEDEDYTEPPPPPSNPDEQDFEPTEEISEDYPVPLPSDI